MRLSATDRDHDSICALSTAQGLGAISVIRISGPKAAAITRTVAAFLPEHPESHKIYYGLLKDPTTGDAIDEVLIAYFQGGRSFTGEQTCEISCHGSETIVNEILAQLVRAGARPAERGEFTYRAFMNGRIDLVQAESVLALIESRSARASRLALRQLQGAFSVRLKELVDGLTFVLANLEANIDFAAEDIVVTPMTALSSRVEHALSGVRTLLANARQGRIVREGFHVALVGEPNVGKSSLLNALSGESRAIVTAIPGTTRDLVEAELRVGGYRVTLTDTAGLRESEDEVEKIGVARGLARLSEADLVFYVVEAGAGGETLAAAYAERIPWDKTVLLMNKSDLVEDSSASQALRARTMREFAVSAVTGQGLDDLKAWLESLLREQVSEDSTLVSHARHQHGLELVAEALEKTLPLMRADESPDLIALELQTALRALYEILGWTYDDQVMDRVFAEFCLGK